MDWLAVKSFSDLIKIASYSYQAPDNLNHLIYDFYFLEWIQDFDLSPSRDNPELNSFATYCLKEATLKMKDVLIDKLYIQSAQSVIIHAGYIVLFGELNKTKENSSDEERDKETDAFMNELASSLNVNTDDLFNYYDEIVNKFLVNPSMNEMESVLNIIIPILNKYPSASTYGGTHLWLNIYNSIKEIIPLNDVQSLIPKIDHIIDLVHNGGSILEYVFANRDDAKKFIDTIIVTKDDVSQIEKYNDYVAKISPSLKNFALKVIYNLTGTTKQMRQGSVDWMNIKSISELIIRR